MPESKQNSAKSTPVGGKNIKSLFSLLPQKRSRLHISTLQINKNSITKEIVKNKTEDNKIPINNTASL